MIRVQLSPPYFPKFDSSRSISGGSVYIGIPDLDPEVVANQKTVYMQQEDGTVSSISQPINLSSGGVPIYNGSAITLLVNGNYSLKVIDSNDSQVYYVPNQGYSQLHEVYYYVSDYADLAAAAAYVNGLGVDCTLVLDDDQTMDESVSFYKEVTIKSMPGKTITTTIGYTLTLNGPYIGAPGAFDGTGTVDFNGTGSLYADKFIKVFATTVSVTGLRYTNPIWHGADNDGTNSNTTRDAFVNALAAIITYNGSVYIPTGTYAYDERIFDITDTCEIYGDGKFQTILTPDGYAGATAFPIRINDCYRQTAGINSSLNTSDMSVSTTGVKLHDFSFMGDLGTDASGTHGICTYDRVDDLHIERVGFLFLNGTALSLGAEESVDDRSLCRESDFNDILIYRCGNATYRPLKISSDNDNDATNDLNFYNYRQEYPGSAALIQNENTAGGAVRRIRFFAPRIHGWHTSASAPADDLVDIIGDIDDIKFIGGKYNGSSIVGGTNYAIFNIDDDASLNKPTRILIDGDWDSSEGNGINVVKCGYLDITGTSYYFNPDTHYNLVVGANAFTALQARIALWGSDITTDIDSTCTTYVNIENPNLSKTIYNNNTYVGDNTFSGGIYLTGDSIAAEAAGGADTFTITITLSDTAVIYALDLKITGIFDAAESIYLEYRCVGALNSDVLTDNEDVEIAGIGDAAHADLSYAEAALGANNQVKYTVTNANDHAFAGVLHLSAHTSGGTITTVSIANNQ